MTDTPNLPALTGTDLFFNTTAFEQLQRAATMFSASTIVPKHLQGRDHIGDCAIALALAHEMHESPVMVMQNIFVVHGKAGWNAQYMIARANKSGIFKGNLKWRFEIKGEIEITKVIKDKPSVKVKVPNLCATCYAVLKETGEEISEEVTMAMAEAEEWTRNSKYHTMPRLMLQYRAATFLVRLNCPEVMMGLPVVDEIEDMIDGGNLTRGEDGVHRADPAAPARPTRKSTKPTQTIDADAEVVADDKATGSGSGTGTGDGVADATGDAVIDELNRAQDSKPETGTTANDAAEEPKKAAEAASDAEPEKSDELPMVKVFAMKDSRGADWDRFKTEFVTALNSVPPEQVHQMVLAHAPQLERMKKESAVQHTGVMQVVKQRAEARTID
jgi:hypothetical protein